MGYLNLLEKELNDQGYNDEYIDLCISYAETLIRQELPVIFDGTHLAKLMGVTTSILGHYVYNTDTFYKSFKIPKKRGGFREIDTPSLNLKMIQRWILDNILKKFPINGFAFGYRDGKNIVDNAKNHTNKKVVYNIDIKDFFPSITRKDIFYIFFNKGYTSEISYILSKILTYKGHLPHGAPTSPYIANLRCERMDHSLSEFTKRIKANYSRYADDITISSNEIDLLMTNINVIKKIVANNKFILNENKERLQFSNQKQEVTGLIVNNGVKVKRKYKKEIEKHIYYCKRFGVYEHLKKNKIEYISYYKEYMYGMVNYVKMIEPDIGNIYLKELNEIKWPY
ncbi:RNA-directed DNA polymerase [Lysinibacillus sp. JK80]|uniref:retron St85 family RNA-directed DNA polymerase n=1 Tax=Lysinibacillus sp. JK80 TaxID=2749809 RepID=UPI0022B99C7F|nr:retron St85 family RNA-directed DNA polymerase [Lysinibacillus sp. JK80]WBF57264.1 RNA-directed DNA polymerase [Lysinibacillus sp. JK80]